MTEDRRFRRPQVDWLEAELLTSVVASADRPRALPPVGRAVERDHQLTTQSLPITVLIDQRLDSSDEVRMTPSGQIRLDPRLNAAKAKARQSSRLCLSERLAMTSARAGRARRARRNNVAARAGSPAAWASRP